MNTVRFHYAAALGLVLAGCFSPHTLSTRHFVLEPVAASGVATNGIAVGVGIVKMPEYLLGSSLVLRKKAGEITYLETALWAERLDNGFTRVLGADLAALVPTTQVRLGAWRAENVKLEVYVTVERFDIDETGTGTLTGWWRITAPGGSAILKSGEVRLTKAGKPPSGDPQNIATALNEMINEFSGTLASAIRETAPTSTVPVPQN